MTQIFLSHSTVDAGFVERLASDLRAAGVVVWKAPESILPGEQWVDAIQRGLQTSSHLVLVVSPAAVKSDWVKFEFNVALMRHHEGRIMIVPVDYRLCDPPPFWRAFQHVRLHDGCTRDEYMQGLFDLIRRVTGEQPAQPPTPAPPETTVAGPQVTVNIDGDVTGEVNVAGGNINIYDLGRPAPPPLLLPAAAPEPEPPDLLTILPPPFEWCAIPAGQVKIEEQEFNAQPFWMAKYPITYAQYQVFIDAPDGFHNDEWWNGLAAGARHREQPGEQQWKINSHPRENVSWYDAVAFCRWLSARLSYEVRLPIEWDWQWAARGSDGREYPWGNDFDTGKCNTRESGIGQTTPVDRYPAGASPFGVMDMAGNVWEWCLNEHPSPGSTRLSSRAARVLRGGSWFRARDFACCACRGRADPGSRSDLSGFRVAVARPPSL